MTRRARASKSQWEPIDLELVRDGYLARVTRTLSRAGRWRWAVTPIEITQRILSQPVEHAYARGYAKGRRRAITMAAAAIEALKAGDASLKRRGTP